MRYDVLRISNTKSSDMNVQLRVQKNSLLEYLQESIVLLHFVFHETGVRTESWTTMGSERSREICFHRKKSMQP